MTVSNQWRVDELAAYRLTELNLKYNIVCIQADQIDVKTSRMNIARDEPVDKSRAADYAKAFTAGAIFPMPVVRRKGENGQYVIAGGNHRHEAVCIINGEPSLMAMVVECDDFTFSILNKTLNIGVGVESPVSLRASHAADLVLGQGVKTQDAADVMSCSFSAVKNELARRKVEDTFHRVGVRFKETPANSTFAAATKLCRSDVTAKLIGECIKQGAKAATIRDITGQCELQTTEAAKADVIKDAIARLKTNAMLPKRNVKAKSVSLVAQLRKLSTTIAKNNTATMLNINEGNREEVVELWNGLKKSITQILINSK